MQRTLPWLTAALFLGCLALGYTAIRQKNAIAQVIIDRSAAEEDAQKRMGELRHQLAAAKAAQVLAERQTAQMAREARANSGSAARGANAGATIIHIGDILKDHPEYGALYAKQMRRNAERAYGNGLNSLNLPPDQLNRLKGLLAERQMTNIDAQQAAEAAGLERGSPAWQDAMKQASQDVEQQITGILGSNADATLAQLQARSSIQNQVESNYASAFSDAGVALTADQSTGLVQAMADANYAGKDTSTRPANYNIADPATGLSPHDDRILANASQVLNPAQLQVLRTNQIQNEQMSAIMRQYNSGGGPVMFVP